MKKHLIIILITVPLLTYSQDYFLEFERYNSEYNFDWRGLEANDNYVTKKAFIDFVEKNNLLEQERQMLKLLNKELNHSIKAVDINNDSQTDIIYQGPWAGEGSMIYFYLNNNSSFKKVFTSHQGIIKVLWKGEIIDKLYVRDWGCCADPTLSNSVYQVTYSDKVPTFSLIWQSIELEEFLSKPKVYFETPKRFEITSEKYKLRANPFIDDTTKNYHLEIIGNTIGILKKGYIGTAYASAMDNTGRIWWYVVIDKDYELENAYINYPYYEFRPQLVGWISSNYVNEL